MRARWLPLLAAVVAAPALAQVPGYDADSSCRMTAGAPGSAEYRQCRVFTLQAYSADPYTAAMGRAGLLYLQQKAFRRERGEDPPDFAAYGTPAPAGRGPAPAASPPTGCVVFGDELGGGIVDCQ